MRRWMALAAALLAGCTERLSHLEYGVSVRDACAPGSYEFGTHCINGAATNFLSFAVSTALTIWVVLSIRSINATVERTEKIVRAIDERSKSGDE